MYHTTRICINGINTFQIQCLNDVDFFERIKIVQENLR